MAPTRLKLLILAGAPEGEDRESKDRARFMDLAETLAQSEIHCVPIFVKTEKSVIDCAAGERPDLVLSALSHVRGHDGAAVNVHAILEEENLPYIGPDPQSMELALDKAALKRRWRECGIATPDFVALSSGLGTVQERLLPLAGLRDFPYIIKPSKEGNSRGIGLESVVYNQGDLFNRAQALLELYDEVLVEHFLGADGSAQEYTCAMIGSGESMLVMPARIDFKDKRKLKVITHDDKEVSTTLATPLEAGPLGDRVRAFAKAAFIAAGARDYGRCDIIEEDGLLYAIEVNGQPMMPDRWFEACSRGAGLGPQDYPKAIVHAAMDRAGIANKGGDAHG